MVGQPSASLVDGSVQLVGSFGHWGWERFTEQPTFASPTSEPANTLSMVVSPSHACPAVSQGLPSGSMGVVDVAVLWGTSPSCSPHISAPGYVVGLFR